MRRSMYNSKCWFSYSQNFIIRKSNMIGDAKRKEGSLMRELQVRKTNNVIRFILSPSGGDNLNLSGSSCLSTIFSMRFSLQRIAPLRSIKLGQPRPILRSRNFDIRTKRSVTTSSRKMAALPHAKIPDLKLNDGSSIPMVILSSSYINGSYRLTSPQAWLWHGYSLVQRLSGWHRSANGRGS